MVARDVDDSTSEQFVNDANFIGPKKPRAELVGEQALEESWTNLPSRIAEQVRAKSAKDYPTSFVLAVAATSWSRPDDQEWMENAIREACLPYINSFSDIWVLAGSHFFSLNDTIQLD